MLFLKGAYAVESITGLPRATRDVDFTVDKCFSVSDQKNEEKLKQLFENAIQLFLEKESGIWELSRVNIQRKPSGKPHPRGWNSLEVKIALKIRGRTEHWVRLDITPEAPPIDTVDVSCETGRVIHARGAGSNTIQSYSSSEIVAEKLRAFLQRLPPHRRKFSGGTRPPRVRDIRDIAVLVETQGNELNIANVARIFKRKCRSRCVDCCNVTDFAPEPDSIGVFKQIYEDDIELRDMPFERAWQLMTGLIMKIERDHGLPGESPINKKLTEEP